MLIIAGNLPRTFRLWADGRDLTNQTFAIDTDAGIVRQYVRQDGRIVRFQGAPGTHIENLTITRRPRSLILTTMQAPYRIIPIDALDAYFNNEYIPVIPFESLRPNA